jgi:hypothetical protein
MMFLALIMAFITRVNLLTAAKPKPSITLGIVTTAALFGEFGSGD